MASKSTHITGTTTISSTINHITLWREDCFSRAKGLETRVSTEASWCPPHLGLATSKMWGVLVLPSCSHTSFYAALHLYLPQRTGAPAYLQPSVSPQLTLAFRELHTVDGKNKRALNLPRLIEIQKITVIPTKLKETKSSLSLTRSYKTWL